MEDGGEGGKGWDRGGKQCRRDEGEHGCEGGVEDRADCKNGIESEGKGRRQPRVTLLVQ